MIRGFFVILTVMFLVACASTHEYSASSPQNQSIKAISIPPGMSSSKIKDYYPVPAAPRGERATKPSLVPPGAKKI